MGFHIVLRILLGLGSRLNMAVKVLGDLNSSTCVLIHVGPQTDDLCAFSW